MIIVPNTLVRRGAAALKTVASSRIHKTPNVENKWPKRHGKDTQAPKPRTRFKKQSSNKAKLSPFPDFLRPTPSECKKTHDILKELHSDAVHEVFTAPDAPAKYYPHAMDALVVAALSQATSWSNVKKALESMKDIYGSPFAYSSIVEGGNDKLVDALRPGGMESRKAKILMTLLNDVKSQYGKWDLQHLFTKTDDEVITEVTEFWGIGLKCAHRLLSICLKRNVFAIDAHIHRLSGLWGWIPAEASVVTAQAHLDARIPNELKFPLQHLMIAHGSTCLRCRGNKKPRGHCKFEKLYKKDL